MTADTKPKQRYLTAGFTTQWSLVKILISGRVMVDVRGGGNTMTRACDTLTHLNILKYNILVYHLPYVYIYD